MCGSPRDRHDTASYATDRFVISQTSRHTRFSAPKCRRRLTTHPGTNKPTSPARLPDSSVAELGSIAEFEHVLMSELALEGLAAARARGRTGRQKPKLTSRQAKIARETYEETGPDGRRRKPRSAHRPGGSRRTGPAGQATARTCTGPIAPVQGSAPIGRRGRHRNGHEVLPVLVSRSHGHPCRFVRCPDPSEWGSAPPSSALALAVLVGRRAAESVPGRRTHRLEEGKR